MKYRSNITGFLDTISIFVDLKPCDQLIIFIMPNCDWTGVHPFSSTRFFIANQIITYVEQQRSVHVVSIFNGGKSRSRNSIWCRVSSINCGGVDQQRRSDRMVVVINGKTDSTVVDIIAVVHIERTVCAELRLVCLTS